MAVKKGNTRLVISISPEKKKELKLKALKNDMSVSELMTMTASEYTGQTVPSTIMGEPKEKAK